MFRDQLPRRDTAFVWRESWNIPPSVPNLELCWHGLKYYETPWPGVHTPGRWRRAWCATGPATPARLFSIWARVSRTSVVGLTWKVVSYPLLLPVHGTCGPMASFQKLKLLDSQHLIPHEPMFLSSNQSFSGLKNWSGASLGVRSCSHWVIRCGDQHVQAQAWKLVCRYRTKNMRFRLQPVQFGTSPFAAA